MLDVNALYLSVFLKYESLCLDLSMLVGGLFGGLFDGPFGGPFIGPFFGPGGSCLWS